MMVISLLLLCLFKAELVVGSGAGYGADGEWNYLRGNWATNYSICGNDAQSPINILSRDTTYNKDLGKLELKNYDQTSGVSFTMKNRDTDIEFKAKADSGDVQDIPQCVVLGGIAYRLYQFHFHWGSKTFQGSEHLLDSQQYAAEMHIIHYNTKYANVSEAIAQADGLLVWGHLLKVDSGTVGANAEFATLVGKFGSAQICCNTTEVSLNLKKLLPSKHDEFYNYKGSLTTPPCYESVNWVVNRNPISVSENQMKEFRKLTDHAMDNAPLADHYRPAQALNGRPVERNFKDLQVVCENVGVSIKPLATILLAAVASFFIM